MTWTDIWGILFPDDTNGYGSWSNGSPAIQPRDTAARLRICYWHIIYTWNIVWIMCIVANKWLETLYTFLMLIYFNQVPYYCINFKILIPLQISTKNSYYFCISYQGTNAPVQTGPWSHPASSTMGTGSFSGSKAAGAWRWPPTHI